VKKIFFDTHIFLDLLMNRSFAGEAEILLEQVVEGRIDGVVADITLLDLNYIAGKQQKDLRDFFDLINSSFQVIGADNAAIKEALEISESDLEKSLLYVLAQRAKADAIVSNDRTFPRRGVRILSSPRCAEEFSR